MSADPAAAVARAVLYEGYMLWPYRRSALKNQRRWTLGSVLPRSWSEPDHTDDAWRMRSECLLVASSAGASLRVRARFLQVVDRRVARVGGDGLEFVDELTVGADRWVAWEEAREREVAAPLLEVRAGSERRVPLDIPEGTEAEWIEDVSGKRRGAVVRGWRALRGEMRVRCEAVKGVANGEAFRIEAEVINTSAWAGRTREDALRSALASTHLVLEATGAELVSLTDPPAELAGEAEACEQVGCWPVLVGQRGTRDRMLASPIILPDYPAIAPESPGDFFDGGEIDEMLTLHVLALTDREKEEMRATDPRTREILERTTALAQEQIRRLHGARRHGRTGDPLVEASRSAGAAPPRPRGLAEDAPDPFWRKMGRPADQRLVVDGTVLQRGSRVRLRPSGRSDVIDIALAGRTAVVEGIDEDDSGGVHLTVVVEGDPGLDLGMARMPGHRFFFRPEEVEPLEESP